MGRLAGKAALVVGAGNRGNMAQEIARRFVAEGATVAVAGRKMGELERFAGEMGGTALPCDLTDRTQVFAMADAAKAALGGIDIAVNATGWGLLKGFLDHDEADVDAMTALQFKGPFYFLQAMVGVMATDLGGRGGSIIQISSATATIMLNDHAAYMGTKAGTDHVVRCVANEFGSVGIRANSISPGLTDTPMNADAKEVPGLFEAFRAGYPLGRWGTSEDIAAAAVFLASDECFMTGENLQVNGGLTLRRNPSREEIAASVQKATQA
ncbi:SDR family oxidoreductase [Sphingomonas jatrophae]|uniref:NAD(P)-dependent dehydrogenase, short-chain alcohol dehydrogenase family n=1 Tax=Sphingomonas jatrophae TaxID=1166337 RepID=A0A1I6M1M9_9SPHN|nr:SDR family oxidoreductase [Sphingomonas jatrophae]SFS09601.1 NAD(P)-dependent dehydrogenase, short-chain alcohol dehydrogenase family [Sphingomonas jatrophae]